MNLSKLFNVQKQLDDHIVKGKGLEGQDLLNKKMLALQVELGELANEWRDFKFWSEDREPRTYALKLGKTPKENKYINPLLEEYVDCLHFILSIGLEIGINASYIAGNYKGPGVTRQFNFVFLDASKLDEAIFYSYPEEDVLELYDELVNSFLGLGEMLGLTMEEIEQYYFDRNLVNSVHTQ